MSNNVPYYNASERERSTPVQFFTDVKDINEDESQLAYIRSGSTTTSALPNLIDMNESLQRRKEYIVLEPIYKDDYLNRCSNCFLFDDVVNAAITRLKYFTLGTSNDFRAILYPESIRPIRSELEAKNEIKQIKIMKTANDVANSIVNSTLSDQEITDFENYLHYTDKVSKLGRFLGQNFISSHIFARSASYIETSNSKNISLNLPAGTPIGIKPLKPMDLGKIIIDSVSWDIKGIEYKDPRVKFKEYVDVGIKSEYKAEGIRDENLPKFLDAEKVLYFVRNNYNTMKEDDDFYFGHSTLQPILPMSEENRRMKQIVIPQLNQGHWAGSMIWKFPNWTQSMMKAFFDTIKPGGHTGVPQLDIQAQPVQLSHDYNGLIALNEMLKTNMLSVFGIPSFIMNIENANTKAVGESVVIGFNESTIQAERSWLTDILDEQWYSRLFQIYFPHDQHVSIKLKIITEFENISFETFFEKAVAVVSLIEKKVITLAEGRNMLKLPPLKPEDYAQLGINVPLVDPATQGVPPAPNMVDMAIQQKQKMMADQMAGTSGGESEAEAKFKAKFNDLKSNVLPPTPRTSI